MKTYNEMFNVGTVKYLVNYCKGEQTHKDGSPFFDIKLFKNKKKKDQFIKDLNKLGYKESKMSIYTN